MPRPSLQRDLVDRALAVPRKLALLPVRTVDVAAERPGVHEYDVALERPTFRLRRYDPPDHDPENWRRPLVVVYPFINDPSILDFTPDRSVIGGFLADGVPVYVFEWTDASPVDRSLTLGDYVTRYLPQCLDVVRSETGVDAVHLLGYSVSAPIVTALAALHLDRVRTLILLGPPLDFGVEAGSAVEQLSTLAAGQDRDRLADAFDTVPTTLLELTLLARRPVEYGVRTPLRIWDRLEDEVYVEDAGRKGAWLLTSPTLPAATITDYVDDLLVENRLVENQLRLNGRRVDPGAIDVPLLLVLGEDDRFVPREASVPILEAVSSTDTAVIELPTGHVGLSVAPEAHEAGWPRVRAWIADRC